MEEVKGIIKRTLPHLKDADVDRITNYLASDDVGVVTVNDLGDVTVPMLKNVLPPIKAVQLHRAFTSRKCSPYLKKNKKTTTKKHHNYL